MIPTKSIRKQVSDARVRRGWSYERLAKETGISRSAIIRYLRGHTDTGTEKADAMLKALK